jgi:4-amino-4-deoxy-L-arabinose transferase-like glycosyltransferase
MGNRSESWILLFLIAFSILLRFQLFDEHVINHDESTYLVIAQHLSNGSTLYLDVTDTKPPGIFWLFRVFYHIVGNSFIGFRFISALFVAFTAFFIYRIIKLK